MLPAADSVTLSLQKDTRKNVYIYGKGFNQSGQDARVTTRKAIFCP